ncbi:hypothetical protein PV10_08474 [Exophiala mesophila]|uniref:Xylanolytic transcriptional activator regulatory domain-containing protein n=1 Tax=Exophiala mesophila TaxID=212818 RepID=A0A0D1XKW3_EXOME|nr:uncharacterized protein PV10_08474 [Exophiala mesophila]KIV88836.1 hypothetical protein PV10_08474 [Exophiala mesophila]
MLFSSLMSASETQMRELLGDKSNVQIGDLYFVTVMASSLTGFPRQPTLYALAAYIYAQSQFIREEEFSDGPEFINTAFRVALGMGLHRNLATAGFTVAEQETRKRLWWYILHLDIMSSCSSGLSPLFVDDKMDNIDPIVLMDKLGGEGNNGTASDIRYLVAATRYDTTKTIRGILIGHFEDKYTSSARVNDAAKDLDALSKRIKKAVSRVLAVGSQLPRQQLLDIYRTGRFEPGEPAVPALSFGSSWAAEADQKQPEVVAFAAWAASLLHLMMHKAYCVLYYPLARETTGHLGADIRETAVKHAQAFIQLFIRVCDAPFSRPFHWMYPGTYQPLQSMSLLLADLLSSPHSDEASTSQGLVDAIFELYQIDQGVMGTVDAPRRKLSPSGQQAWSMLGRVRRKALEQMDQDPHVAFPSSLASSNTCICGESLVHACLLEENEKQEEVIPEEPSIVGLEPDLEMGLETSVEAADVRFDWEDWDAFLGNSAGAMI